MPIPKLVKKLSLCKICRNTFKQGIILVQETLVIGVKILTHYSLRVKSDPWMFFVLRSKMRPSYMLSFGKTNS